jgi:hypothetical protein
MIRPVEMQLSVWRAEQNATQQPRDPAAAAAQAAQQGEMAQESQTRDRRIQEGQEAGAENRVTSRREEPPRERRRRKKSSAGPSPEGIDEDSEEGSKAPPSLKGLDFYA